MPTTKSILNPVYKQILDPTRPILREDIRYFELYGGRRSAKSHEVAKVLLLTALSQPGHFIPCIRKVGTTLKDSVFAEIIGAINETPGVTARINKTDKEVTFPNGSRIRCFGLDDSEKLKSLKGATIIWIEESNELTGDDLDSLDAGLSPTNYPGRIIMTHNPVPQIPGHRFWFQERFDIPHDLGVAAIDEDKNCLVLRTWYKHNLFCPKETIRVLEGYEQSNPQKYKLWALGEYTTMEGCVFDNWDTVESVPEGIDSIGYGLDFGFSQDPAAIVQLWVYQDQIWVKGLIYKTGLSNADLVKEMTAAGVPMNELITADSAEPKSIEDLRRAGYRSIRGVKKRSGYKEDLVNRIRSFRLHLVEGDVNLAREFSTYSWSRDKMGRQLPKLQDGDDHYVDAFIMRIHDYYQHLNQKSGTVSASSLGL